MLSDEQIVYKAAGHSAAISSSEDTERAEEKEEADEGEGTKPIPT